MSALLFLPIENKAFETKGDPDIDPYYIYSIGHYSKDIGFIICQDWFAQELIQRFTGGYGLRHLSLSFRYVILG